MIEIRVIGTPAPQGSKRPFRNKFSGKLSMIESSAKVKPWREAVKCAAREMVEVAPAIAGPISLAIVFTLPKPKSAKRGSFPSKKPDLSKLVRSTEDALTEAGIWEDDSRVVRCAAIKVYPNEGRGSMDVPGALIRVSAWIGD